MQLQNIKVINLQESKTNPRGRKFEGKEFDDLVNSIREKGVLMPVLVRKVPGQPENTKFYEIIAGNRRLRAAIKAKVEEIPAKIVEMNDIEAQEAQIVENLQRQDVHPLEEGEAYRKLIEESKYEISAVAAKVGKSESYVKQRLFLTNLEKKPAEAYRSGIINDGFAVVIAKLSSSDQITALKTKIDRSWMTVKDLTEWIKNNIYSSLEFQPWLKSQEFTEAAGKCKECEPTRASLFGPVKEGACTDLKCWTRKMTNYINYRAEKENLAKITKEYGKPPKGIIERDNYLMLPPKIKEHCKFARQAIVAHGENLGTIVWICDDKECKTHKLGRSQYTMTPKEKEERKKEQEKQKKEEALREKKFVLALKKIKWPLSEKHLNMLVDIAIEESYLYPEVANRHGLTDIKKDKDGTTDYEGAIRKMVDDMTNVEKARLIFELLINPEFENGTVKKI